MRQLQVTLLFNVLLLAPIYSAPTMTFTVHKLARSINNIWKRPNNTRPTTGTKPTIYTRTIDRQIIDPTETWSNCRAVRIKPGNRRCSYLVVIGDIVKGRSKEIVPPEDEIFQIETYGKSIVRLKHVASNQYVYMNNKGHIEITKDPLSEESLFLHILEEKTYMDTFASVKYYMSTGHYDLFLGVRNQRNFECKTKNGKRTRPDQLSNQFFLDTKYIDQTKYCKKILG